MLAGVGELQQWLSDQVRHGLAGLESAGYRHFEPVAARLIDAQAPGLAGAVRRLATIPSSGAGWEERALAEMALLHLLTGAADRLDRLPPELAATVNSRLGHQVTTAQVLEGPAVRDVWQVIGVRDLSEDQLLARRAYLIGRDTGQEALVLSFAAPGQTLSADLVVGTGVDADLCFYPGSLSLRALVSARHGVPEVMREPQRSTSVAAALTRLAGALARDPWLMSMPLLLDGVIAPGERWHLVDPSGEALPLEPGVDAGVSSPLREGL